MTPDIPTLRRQLQQLQELHASGALDDAHYEEGRQRLERQLVDRVMSDSSAATPTTPTTPAAGPAVVASPRPSRRLVALSSAFVLLVAVAGYAWTGAPALSGLAGPPPMVAADTEAAPEGDAQAASAAGRHQVTPEQIAAMVDKLKQRLEAEPDNAEGWLMLARSYSVLGRPKEAGPAYLKAIALNPQDAGLLADYADTLAVINDRKLDGEPMKLVERALKLDPNQPKALSLAGTAAFTRKDYAGAVSYWERILPNLSPDSPFAQQVQASIDEARTRGGLGARPKLALAGAAAVDGTAQAPANAGESATGTPATASGGGQVSGTVTLSKDLAGKAGPDDTVFIFARAAEGPRMPLAILRKQVKDLPVTFKLDDSTAMGPQMKLSNFTQVVVGARISKSGNAMPQPGDLQGLSAPLAVGSSGLKIEINQAVGP